MLTHKPGKDAEPLTSQKRVMGLSAAVLGVAVCGYALISYGKFCAQQLLPAGDYSIEQIGKALLNSDKFGLLLPFEAVSVLLLACIIGGVVVARRR